jgi:hypothetical protein
MGSGVSLVAITTEGTGSPLRYAAPHCSFPVTLISLGGGFPPATCHDRLFVSCKRGKESKEEGGECTAPRR